MESTRTTSVTTTGVPGCAAYKSTTGTSSGGSSTATASARWNWDKSGISVTGEIDDRGLYSLAATTEGLRCLTFLEAVLTGRSVFFDSAMASTTSLRTAPASSVLSFLAAFSSSVAPKVFSSLPTTTSADSVGAGVLTVFFDSAVSTISTGNIGSRNAPRPFSKNAAPVLLGSKLGVVSNPLTFGLTLEGEGTCAKAVCADNPAATANAMRAGVKV